MKTKTDTKETSSQTLKRLDNNMRLVLPAVVDATADIEALNLRADSLSDNGTILRANLTEFMDATNRRVGMYRTEYTALYELLRDRIDAVHIRSSDDKADLEKDLKAIRTWLTDVVTPTINANSDMSNLFRDSTEQRFAVVELYLAITFSIAVATAVAVVWHLCGMI